MVHTNLASLRRALTRQIDRQLDPIYELSAKSAHEEAMVVLISHIRNHRVSREFDKQSKLYGFFGFEYPKDPVSELIDYLEEIMEVRVYGPVINGNARIHVNFPTKEDFRRNGLFSLKWEAGKSWVEAVELGIPNFGQFLPKLGIDKSRSTQGIQVEGEVNSFVYEPSKDYLSEGIRKYREIFVKAVKRKRIRKNAV